MSTSLTEQAATLAIVGACHSLHLPTVRAQHGELADAAVRDRLTQQAFLAEVLGAELDERDGRRRERRIAEAKFPRMKLLDDFDAIGYSTFSASCTSGHRPTPSAGSATCGTWSATRPRWPWPGRG
jgi:IstB-like ATP binding protein